MPFFSSLSPSLPLDITQCTLSLYTFIYTAHLHLLLTGQGCIAAFGGGGGGDIEKMLGHEL